MSMLGTAVTIGKVATKVALSEPVVGAVKTLFSGLKEVIGTTFTSKELTSAENFYKNQLKGFEKSIRNKNEIVIYQKQGLKPQMIANKLSLVKTDAYMTTPKNLHRMLKGKPPLDFEGKPLSLHHIGQDSDSPLAQLTQGEHQANSHILHESNGESKMERKISTLENKLHWQEYAKSQQNNNQ